MELDLEERVKHYWTKRAHDFGVVRKNELENDMAQRWLDEINTKLPADRTLDILDVGTGTGFFAVLLSGQGHRVHGIDLTPAMIEEASTLAKEKKLDISFEVMNAQELTFKDHSFDVVISRNLTWTLPDCQQAYQEWYRVLRPGGMMLNFDADYAANVRSQSNQNSKVKADSPYGHVGMTSQLQEENDAITLAMDHGNKRPPWDIEVLKQIGFRECVFDTEVGKRMLGTYDLQYAPMFGIYAKK